MRCDEACACGMASDAGRQGWDIALEGDHMEKINVIHHMNEFRNILSYATNIGFFFGAGTSCAFGLPTINPVV